MKQKPFKKIILITVILVLTGFVGGYGFQKETVAAVAASPDSPTLMVPMNFSQLAKEAQPGVVNIRTVRSIKGGGPVFRHFFGNPFGPQRRPDQQNPFRDFFGPFSENSPQR